MRQQRALRPSEFSAAQILDFQPGAGGKRGLPGDRVERGKPPQTVDPVRIREQRSGQQRKRGFRHLPVADCGSVRNILGGVKRRRRVGKRGNDLVEKTFELAPELFLVALHEKPNQKRGFIR